MTASELSYITIYGKRIMLVGKHCKKMDSCFGNSKMLPEFYPGMHMHAVCLGELDKVYPRRTIYYIVCASVKLRQH